MPSVTPIHPRRGPAPRDAARDDEHAPDVVRAAHRITVEGELEHRAADAGPPSTSAFRALRGTIGLVHERTNATLLSVHEVVEDDDVIEVQVLGTLQHDHALTATVVVTRLGPALLDDEPESCSTVVEANGASSFTVVHVDAAGDRVTASGVIRNEVLTRRHLH